MLDPNDYVPRPPVPWCWQDYSVIAIFVSFSITGVALVFWGVFG